MKELVDYIIKCDPKIDKDADGYDYTCGFEDGVNFALQQIIEFANHAAGRMKISEN